MKRAFLLLILLVFFPTTLAQAQTAVTLESLEVELWPDYDQESVLVLLTGTLPASVPLPTTLTIPLPDGADFNVVARITPDNVMSDQGMTPNVSANEVTFTLAESRFRVEYYQPYLASNTQRSFTFSWQSNDIGVEQLNVTLQQPFAATNVTVVPTPINVSEGRDGLTYHVLPGQAVAAGETYNVEVGYTMSVPTLTADLLASSEAGNEELPILTATPVEDGGVGWQIWLLGLGSLILVAVAVWYFIGSSKRQASSRRPAKPKPQRVAKQTARQAAARFCHQCGQAVTAGDKFCRNCGTAVKQ